MPSDLAAILTKRLGREPIPDARSVFRSLVATALARGWARKPKPKQKPATAPRAKLKLNISQQFSLHAQNGSEASCIQRKATMPQKTKIEVSLPIFCTRRQLATQIGLEQSRVYRAKSLAPDAVDFSGHPLFLASRLPEISRSLKKPEAVA